MALRPTATTILTVLMLCLCATSAEASVIGGLKRVLLFPAKFTWSFIDATPTAARWAWHTKKDFMLVTE